MGASQAELTKLENEFVEVGIQRERAKTLAMKCANGDPRDATKILFGETIDKMAADVATELEKIIKVGQDQAYAEFLQKLLRDNRLTINKTKARTNLLALGLTKAYVDWAVNKRKPLTATAVLYRTQKQIQKGRSLRKARAQGAREAIEDAVITKAMLGKVAHLGEPLSAAALFIIGLIVSLLLAGIGIAIDLILRYYDKKDARALTRQLQNKPLIAMELAMATDAAAEKDTWEKARQVFLNYIDVHRNGRKKFLSGEEEEYKEQWTEMRSAVEAERMAAQEEIDMARQVNVDVAAAGQRGAEYDQAGSVISSLESRGQLSVAVGNLSKVAMIGVPVLGAIGAIAYFTRPKS